jgi:hypothetical protein
VPRWRRTSKATVVSKLINCWIKTRWPELEIGNHSVNPWTTARKSAQTNSMV